MTGMEAGLATTFFDASRRYRLLGTLGAGAFGVVYRVLDERWGHEVALKTIDDASPEVRQWLKAEYRTLRDIVHPHLVRLHDLHVDDERCFFTMDVVPDALPFDRRFAVDRGGGPATIEAGIRRVCRAGRDLASALAAVHSLGKCHRDIKPSNVLATPDDHVVLVDFGLASAIERQRVLDTARGAVVGTLPYLAPEQYEEPRPLPASDWYSVGLLLYEALVGTLPFGGAVHEELRGKRSGPVPPSQHVPEIPGPLDKLLMKLLDPDAASRPAAAEILDVLDGLAHERPRGGAISQSLAVEGELVGREDELATLTRAASGAEERLVTVEVIGPSGMGKTALVRHFLAGLPESTLVLEARCHPQESIPYKAFDAIVDDLTRYWLGLDVEAARRLRPPDGAGALALLFPALRRVPALDARAAELVPRGDPRALRQEGFRALRTVLARLSARRRVVMWIDDAQWADADSLALLEAVFAATDAPPLCLVLTRRPDGEAGSEHLHETLARVRGHARSNRLELQPLADAAARELARSITARRGAALTDTVTAILDEAAGVPYLIAELAHFTAQHGHAPASAASSGALTRERLAALSDGDRTIVEVAALSGSSQPVEILLEAAGTRDHTRLRDLCLLRLLRWTGGGEGEAAQIYHDRLREFVVAALPSDEAARRHLAIVTAMERASASDPEQMMAHALAASDRPRARSHALAAARRAETALAFEQAARLYDIALACTPDGEHRGQLLELLAEALANAGHSKRAAPAFEQAVEALESEEPTAVERRGFLRRRAGEQYLKAGHFDDGLRLMQAFLAEAGVTLPRTGNRALLVSAARRVRLYLRGFHCEPRPLDSIPVAVRNRLDDLWAATTALSMMDPVRSDGVGLLHFLESLQAGHTLHVARSLGYEAAFASLIGGPFMRRKAADLLQRNRAALEREGGPYERAFYQLGAGTAAFFHSAWRETVSLCESATDGFRKECRGAEYEAAVAIVWVLQALAMQGRVADLCARIPAAIREADARGDLFAANNYRGGFHAVARIAGGHLDEVRADLERVVETWKPGFYQMHAYHRVFAEVAANLSTGQARAAVDRIEGDWPVLRAGLYLRMELPAMELRWTRARAALALSFEQSGWARRRSLARAGGLVGQIERATPPAARAHAALLRAGIAVADDSAGAARDHLRSALGGYQAADMHMHAEVCRWTLGRLTGGDEGAALAGDAQAWMVAEGVPAMPPLVRALAPGLDRLVDAH